MNRNFSLSKAAGHWIPNGSEGLRGSGQLCIGCGSNSACPSDTTETVAELPPYPLSTAYFERLLVAPHHSREEFPARAVEIILCCVTKLGIRPCDLALVAPVLEGFTVSKGTLLELDLPSFVDCKLMQSFRIPGDGCKEKHDNSLKPCRFTHGLPVFPPSLRTLILHYCEDSERFPCNLAQSLHAVTGLAELHLGHVTFRSPIPSTGCLAALKQLSLCQVLAPSSTDFWPSCPSLEIATISGASGTKRNEDGTPQCCPMPLDMTSTTSLPATLRKLSLVNVSVDHLPLSLGECSGMLVLEIRGCGLKDLPESLLKLCNLANLSLCNNALTLSGIAVLQHCQFLKSPPPEVEEELRCMIGPISTRAVSLAGNPLLEQAGVPLNASVIDYLVSHLSEQSAPAVDEFFLDVSITSALRVFKYADLQRAADGFSAARLISAEGAFGSVYLATFGRSQRVAVKVMRDLLVHNEEQFTMELRTLYRCRHPHILALLGYAADEQSNKCLVYEYKELGSLRGILDKESPQLKWQRRLCILSQVLSGVEYLHVVIDPPIIHRDIKSSNILLDGSLSAAIGDFGVARICPDMVISGSSAGTTRILGTPGYIDPEYAQSGHLTFASDIFSVGIVALELLTSAAPFDSSQETPSLLHRFEDALEERTIGAFSPIWPNDAAQQFANMVKSFVAARARKRPDSSGAASQANLLCTSWAANPLQLLAQEASGPKCVVCLDSTATHALLPCGHRCVCATDLARLVACPMCRTGIARSVHIYDA